MSTRNPITRFLQIRSAIRRYGLLELIDDLPLPKTASLGAWLLFGKAKTHARPLEERIRLALEELGPVFIKFGQALSTRPDLLSEKLAHELSKLQNDVPPMEGSLALDIINQNFGENANEIFEHINAEPMASASVAQVHAATLKEGLALEGKNKKKQSDVIIKVLRPNVERLIKSDLRLMRMIANQVEKFSKKSIHFKPRQVVSEFENTILGELDLRREAANCSQMGANFIDTDIIYVPFVYWDYSNENVMVMERIYGTSVKEVDKLKELGYDLKQLAADGVNTFFKQAFEDNFFHADMHPGNIFVSDQGKWIAIDFGIMGVLNESDKRYLAQMLLGFFHRDYQSIAQAHLRAGWIPETTQLAEFESAIRMVCEPNFAKPISEISFGRVLIDLLHTVQRFEMPVQPQLVLLYKTLLQVEGLGRQLYPQLNLWNTAKPFLEKWMAQQLSPQTLFEEFKRDWPQWKMAVTELPEYLQSLRDGSHYQRQLNEQLQRREEQDRISRYKWLHMNIGLGLAIPALVMFTAKHLGLNSGSLNGYAYVMAVLGLIWAFWKSR